MVLNYVSLSWLGKDVIVQVNGHVESVKAMIVDEVIESVTDPLP